MKLPLALLSLALASATLAEEPAPGPAGYGKPDGIIPGIAFGPKLAFLPVPSLYGVGLEARVRNTVGVTLDYATLPSFKVPNAANGDARMEYRDLDLALRWFPWSERFYLGAAFGTRSFKATATDATTGLRGQVDVRSSYVAPELGWRFIWPSGLFMGIDLGWQIITSTSSTFDLPAGMNAQDQKDLTDAADTIGKTGLPILSLLQVGLYL